MKISDNVYFYQGLDGGTHSWSNSTVIIGRHKTILIDSGSNLKGHLDDLKAAMAEDGIDISKINELWYTHSHPDHAGSAGALSEQYKIKVRCHSQAQDILSGPSVMKKFLIALSKEVVRERKIIRMPFFWRRLGLRLAMTTPFSWFFSWLIFGTLSFIFEKIWGEWLPVFGLEVFDEEETIEVDTDLHVRIILLPGHTLEEIGFWIEEQKIVIIGDLVSMSGQWREKMPILNNPRSSFKDTISSLKKLSDLPVGMLIPGHGLFIRDEKIIKYFLTKIIFSMKHHRKQVQALINENPKINIDQLSSLVLKDLPSIAPDWEKKNYLVAILDDLGYFN